MIVLASLFVSLTGKASRLCRKHFAKKKSVPMHLKEKNFFLLKKEIVAAASEKKATTFL